MDRYDWKEITVNKDMETACTENYENFGWELVNSSFPYHGALTVALKFKRDMNIRNKEELNKLEEQFEKGFREIQRIERRKRYGIVIPSVATGITGLALFFGAIFSFASGNAQLGVILLIPAVVGMALASYFSFVFLARKNKQVIPQINKKYQEINEVCEQARSLATEIVRLQKDLETALEAAETANHNLEEINRNLERLVEEKTQEVNIMHTKMLDTFATIIEYRSLESGQHIRRTMELTKVLVGAMLEKPMFRERLIELNYDSIIKAVPLHDVGKVGIPDNILLKPGKLTADEYEVIKTHTRIGRDMIRSVAMDMKDEKQYLKHGMDIALYHHERWDGSGYAGIKGADIPLSARIVAVVDVYDALVNKRCYKANFSYEETVGIIADGRGTQFDPDIVDVFLEITDEFEKITNEFGDK